MRVFTAVLATETNTFSPIPTGLGAFKSQGEYYPAGQHPDRMTLFGAPLWVARERARDKGWSVVEGMVAFAQPGGKTTRIAYDALRSELLDDLRAAGKVDMVLLGLHGAMIADGCDDCEGDILRAVREIVGPDVVIGAELDPHCHLTQVMMDNADVMVAFKEYPHTDLYERGVELVDLCMAAVEKRIRPVAALADTGMATLIFTTSEPGISLVERMKEMERLDGVLSVSIVQGFPWADVPDMGTRVLVYTNGDQALADRLAREFATDLYAMREDIDVPKPGIDEVLDVALAEPTGPVVIADGADNAGGGAASDSTFMLRRMLERGIDSAALGPIWDPVSVQLVFDAGEGAVMPLRIGGKVGPSSGDPLDVECTVKALRRDMKMGGLGGITVSLGDCALIEVAGIDVVLTTIRFQAMDTDLFTQLGCDLATRRIVVVKSTQHFYASYSKVAKKVLYAAARGTVTPDLSSLPYTRIASPKWPISAGR
ncbi:M81 family metallopeptidase [Mesorhizobium microcysteis]|uniref:Microcystinase C n=1 Tax=Neoaquamicrobium microcysteis TaxID=2682781 RepID=A0A5D4H341_9HYPH|nr:M81 family metallopeptidase [Mesorhizobium microcysteis]TYR35461.1 M81 family metallopeptidase [Mesorhizobium microcysteis]